MSGILYVVATPIGNLEDITYRAVRVLQEVDLIAAEDTRHSRRLLDHYAIRTPLISYHEHNETKRSEQLRERLLKGESLALISDAGTPGIADPGYRLVLLCRQAGIDVVSVPGPSALVAALSIAGLPTDSFLFIGFLPAKALARRGVLQALVAESRTVACYEAPHRLQATLEDIVEVLGGERTLAVARELTKRHEELFHGTADQAAEYFSAGKVKGELVLLLGPALKQRPQGTVRDNLLRLRRETELSWKEIVKQVAREFDLPAREVYRESLDLRELQE
ncbi:MAG: 16S rRNA (cytidine(1402)-2'-O)-methyltransferase [Desulfuromonadales bacterium]|nr:16S rRNA (cytidine(1402)-2'-O)-methyltransferase [Desulfuromonadales bacterium]